MTTSKRSTKLSAVEAVAGDRDLMKALMKEALQEVLEGEMTEFLGAEPAVHLSANRFPALRPQASIGERRWRRGSVWRLAWEDRAYGDIRSFCRTRFLPPFLTSYMRLSASASRPSRSAGARA